MEYTNQEIVKSYEAANNKKMQIRILAELNGCTKDEIKEILKEEGCELPKYGNRYTVKKDASDATKTQAEELDKEASDIIGDWKNALEAEAEKLQNDRMVLQKWQEDLTAEKMRLDEKEEELRNREESHILGIPGVIKAMCKGRIQELQQLQEKLERYIEETQAELNSVLDEKGTILAYMEGAD